MNHNTQNISHQQKACNRKLKYPNKHQAKKSIKYFNNKFNTKLYYYNCNVCNKIHLTSKKRYRTK